MGKARLDIHSITYILEVPDNIDLDNDLQAGDRIIITEERDPEKLNNKRVAVLLMEDTEKGIKFRATLRTFFYAARDHYFLKADDESATSVVVSKYGASTEKIEKYYEKYKRGGSIDHKIAYDVRISGEVKGIIRRGTVFFIPSDEIPSVSKQPGCIEPIIWKIPIVEHISDGQPEVIQRIVEFLYLEKEGVSFGFKVKDKSMKDSGILPGNIALISKEIKVQNRNIAAVKIKSKSPKTEIEILRRYYVRKIKGVENSQHWRLVSNPRSENLIVIPQNIEVEIVKAIEDYYRKKPKGEIRFKVYKDAAIIIVGKFIETIEVKS